MNRRNFLSSAAIASAAAFPGLALGQSGRTYSTALIGTGWWGMNILGEAMAARRSKVVAMCDVDENQLNPAWEKVNKLTGESPRKYKDYRELLR